MISALFAQQQVTDWISQNWPLVLGIFLILFAIIGAIIFFKFLRLWIQAWLTGARIGILDLVGMYLRKVDYDMIVQQKIALVQAGVKVNTQELEAHFLASGSVQKTAKAVISAHKAGFELAWREAAAINLAGRDVEEAVKISVQTQVIDCPDPSVSRSGTTIRETLDAVCKNGIQLKVKARVTVRTKLNRLIGGAWKETIIARVGEGIVQAIGSSETHQDVLSQPNKISQAVLNNSLDSQTAFEIVSIDIADIIVGENIGAQLQVDQAKADLRVAEAQAEKRRALAVALEQEMRAKVEENRARVVMAEAEVPLAIAQAFREGKLGVMDYYNMRNVQSDTEMRNSIAGLNPQSKDRTKEALSQDNQ